MEDESYEKIREEAKAEPEKAEEKAAEPKPKKKAEKPPKEKPPRMICEGCGRSYSIHTKRHNCKAPQGFGKKKERTILQEDKAPPSLQEAKAQ